jgi:hypothetical protein
MRLKLQFLKVFTLLGSAAIATTMTLFQPPIEPVFAQLQGDRVARCTRDLMRIGIDEYNADLVCEDNPIRIRPGGSNINGTYPKGGGCNLNGCWLPGGGCSLNGCWPPGGSSNLNGTSATGRCTLNGCPAKVPNDLFNLKGKL